MEDQLVKERTPTVRERIDKLHAMMAEALAIEAKITGDIPSPGKAEEATEYALDVIEQDLDRALGRARDIVDQLKRIEQRL